MSVYVMPVSEQRYVPKETEVAQSEFISGWDAYFAGHGIAFVEAVAEKFSGWRAAQANHLGLVGVNV